MIMMMLMMKDRQQMMMIDTARACGLRDGMYLSTKLVTFYITVFLRIPHRLPDMHRGIRCTSMVIIAKDM